MSDPAAAPTREIVPPARVGPLARGLIVGALVVMATYVVAPARWMFALTAFAMLLAFASAVARESVALHATMMIALLVGWPLLGGPAFWPLGLLGPLLAYGGAVALARRLRGELGWLRRGRLDARVLAGCAAVALLSFAALALWLRVAHPPAREIAAILPPFGTVGLVVVAVVHAALEEAIWRGVLLHSLDAAFGAGVVALVIQAVSFGFAPAFGFPRGAVGFAMLAGFGFGLGLVRRHARGLIAPFLAHALALVAMFTMLERAARAMH